MLRFKPGVRAQSADGSVETQNTIWFAIGVFAALFAEVGKDCVVTSLCDGKHRKGSKHYDGEGGDIRSKNLTAEESHRIEAKAKSILEPLGYDVILELEGTEHEHFHIEFDPKPGEEFVRYTQ